METVWTILFIFSATVVVYTYLGYGALLYCWVGNRPRRIPVKRAETLPEVTHIVTAYNEEDCIEEKIKNCLMLDYPMEKIQTIVITDGSNDRTMELVANNPRVKLMHQPQRRGKLAAMARAVAEVQTPITVFSDANAMLNKQAVKKMVRHFSDENVAAVAGEKRVVGLGDQNAGQGEGLYWKYESYLKKLDARLHTVVGAAGELFALRTHLFEIPKEEAIIEDFVLTVSLAGEGYRVAYEPDAVATEHGSANILEELKRKIRISAGGLQASWRLRHLLNPFRHGLLAFQLFSHRVIRWTLAPVSLFLLLLSSIILSKTGLLAFQVLTIAQVLFYLYAILAYYLEVSGKTIKYGLAIFYFAFMNFSVFLGLMFLIRQREMMIWEKAKRA